jgi:hypothetical protein
MIWLKLIKGKYKNLVIGSEYIGYKKQWNDSDNKIQVTNDIGKTSTVKKEVFELVNREVSNSDKLDLYRGVNNKSKAKKAINKLSLKDVLKANDYSYLISIDGGTTNGVAIIQLDKKGCHSITLKSFTIGELTQFIFTNSFTKNTLFVVEDVISDKSIRFSFKGGVHFRSDYVKALEYLEKVLGNKHHAIGTMLKKGQSVGMVKGITRSIISSIELTSAHLHPQLAQNTKYTHENFVSYTGWNGGQTNEHKRDALTSVKSAIDLVYGWDYDNIKCFNK